MIERTIGIISNTIENEEDFNKLREALKKQGLIERGSGKTYQRSELNAISEAIRSPIIIVALDGNLGEEELESKKEEALKNIQHQAFIGGKLFPKQVFIVSVTSADVDMNIPLKIEILSNQVIQKEGPSQVKGLRVRDELNKQVNAAVEDLHQAANVEMNARVDNDKEKIEQAGARMDFNLKKSLDAGGEETNSMHAEAEVHNRVHDEGDSLVSEVDDSLKSAELNIEEQVKEPPHISTGTILQLVSSIQLPEFNDTQEFALKDLLDKMDKSIHFDMALQAAFNEVLQKIEPGYRFCIAQEELNQFISCVQAGQEIMKWRAQSGQIAGSRVLDAADVLPITTQLLIDSRVVIRQKDLDKVGEWQNFFAKYKKIELHKETEGMDNTVVFLHSAMQTAKQINANKLSPLNSEELTQTNRELVEKLGSREEQKKAELVSRLELMRTHYTVTLNKKTHAKRFNEVIKKVKKADNYDDALSKVEQAFRNRKKRYDIVKTITGFFSQNARKDFKQKLAEEQNTLEYPKALGRVLNEEYASNPALLMLPSRKALASEISEIKAHVDNVDDLQMERRMTK